MTPYDLAQTGITHLKRAVYKLLEAHPNGLTNAQIGRRLGIYTGHVGHVGHISRTMLAIMEGEEVVSQSIETKVWRLRVEAAQDTAPEADISEIRTSPHL